MNESACSQLAGATFRKSSYSGANGQCVEVARTDTAVGLRDSKLAESPVIPLASDRAEAFLNTLKRG